jgi:tetratricopeptide (TPR) repeat protein
VAEQPSDARIRDLKRRLELDPTSRLFVSLAEEYRKAGRVADALITLQQGLRNHPGYISAQVALGRAYLEAGNVSEAIATFNKVLTVDPGNLVSAKSLADIFLSRGESLEAIKKYKLYRALSGDRTVDDMIVRLEREIAPPAPRPSRVIGPTPLPAPPTFFDEAPVTGPVRVSRASEIPDSRPGSVRPSEDILDVTSIKWEESTAGKKQASPPGELPPPPPGLAGASDLPTQPFHFDEILPPPLPELTAPAPTLAPAPEAAAPFLVGAEAEEPAAAGQAPQDEVFGEAGHFSSERPTDKMEPPAAAPADSGDHPGRALADLYYAQGHYTEALRIYDELVTGNPFDAELKRLRRDAEARLLPAGLSAEAATGDAGLQRRLARIRALKEWLSVVQAG